MVRTWQAPRRHGVVTGLGLMLLGAWGAIIPFVGPYFDYAYTPNRTWAWTAGRGYLEVLPGAVAFLAGLVLLMTSHRAKASLAGWFGVAAGAWFVVGPLLAVTWSSADVGRPVGGTRAVAAEQIGMFYGLGAAIILFAAAAVGRFSVATLRDTADAAVVPESTQAAMENPAGQPAVAPTGNGRYAPTTAAPTYGQRTPAYSTPAYAAQSGSTSGRDYGSAQPTTAMPAMNDQGGPPAAPPPPPAETAEAKKPRHSWVPGRHGPYAAHQ